MTVTYVFLWTKKQLIHFVFVYYSLVISPNDTDGGGFCFCWNDGISKDSGAYKSKHTFALQMNSSKQIKIVLKSSSQAFFFKFPSSRYRSANVSFLHFCQEKKTLMTLNTLNNITNRPLTSCELPAGHSPVY